MDGHSFDDLLRDLSNSRRSLLGTALAAAAAISGLSVTDAKKKKKKKCAKKCKDGCCTGKYGKCIKPAQQNATQCGTGGETCRSNCGGGACGAGCEGCCANGTCLDASQVSNEQCGTGGQTCFACPAGQACNAPGEGCCALQGAACGTNGVECCSQLLVTCGPDNFCCVENGGSCNQTSDCCDDEDVCDGGQCLRPLGAPCVPGDIMCIPTLECHVTTLTCGPIDCTNPCAEQGRCSQQICPGVLNCCTQATFDECSGAEDFCGCITEGGECTRLQL